MDTKLKSDIAESAVLTELLKRGFSVLKPVGDRLPYDIALDSGGKLVRIQVKSAWFSKEAGCHIVDVRRTKTNRRHMLRKLYGAQDFDFAVIYLNDLDVFYVMPVSVFTSFGSTISLVETEKRQRKPKSAEYRNRWELLSQWAHSLGTRNGYLSNSVEPEMAIPSQAPVGISAGDGVETRG
jgi:hypothetical protein